MPAPQSNRRTGLGLAAVVALMVGASFAAVPFYSWFCRVTGYAGTTGVAAAPEARAGWSTARSPSASTPTPRPACPGSSGRSSAR